MTDGVGVDRLRQLEVDEYVARAEAKTATDSPGPLASALVSLTAVGVAVARDSWVSAAIVGLGVIVAAVYILVFYRRRRVLVARWLDCQKRLMEAQARVAELSGPKADETAGFTLSIRRSRLGG